MTMVLKMSDFMGRLSISKAKLKPHLLKYLREVQTSGRELIVTDRGRPVLKIVRYTEKPPGLLKKLRGSVTKYKDPLKPVQVDWSAQA